ncbi:Uncharacterised protein [Klebsiella pneumoniae]|nr:Uncharacterised protein [Klebsiella pneumoniae]
MFSPIYTKPTPEDNKKIIFNELQQKNRRKNEKEVTVF